jgi:hypothetical protein
MIRPLRSALLPLSLLPLAACAAGAHKRVDGKAFTRLCAAAEPATVRTTTWIGRTSDRAYIEVWHGGPWWLGGGIDVCSVLLADLPTAVREAVLKRELVMNRAPGAAVSLAMSALATRVRAV